MSIIVIANSTQAIDPDHVESMDIAKKTITTSSGTKMFLSEADFAAIFQAKSGGKQ